MTLNEFIKELTDFRDRMPHFAEFDVVDGGRDEVITKLEIIPGGPYMYSKEDALELFEPGTKDYVSLEFHTGE